MSTPFTGQELTRAWRQLSKTANPKQDAPRDNTHRLMLFYAVECGLKAVWLKRNNKTLFSEDIIKKTGHDLIKILSNLRAGKQLALPENIQLDAVDNAGKQLPRNGGVDILHQTWRYGGKCKQPTDAECEQKLEQVQKWISGELR